MEPKERLLTREEVQRRVGHSCSWIYARVAAGTFPAPLKLAATSSVRWLESEIDGYITEEIRRNKEARARLRLRGDGGAVPTTASKVAV